MFCDILLPFAKSMSKKIIRPLNQFLATAICGNNILSSVLYVSGIAIIFAGVWAPLILLAVGIVLFLYRAIYREVVEALPVNGGVYNCLLNGTQKIVAATTGMMILLSYVATAVISAKIALEYLHTILPVPVISGTVLLLLFFALLMMLGISDSARVAAGIFVFHIFSLLLFLALGVSFIQGGQSVFASNVTATGGLFASKGALLTFFLAFSASFLGVSGFESSANFVEEQAPGVFRKTLRNMLVGVLFFNPLIALVLLSVMPIAQVAEAKDFVLSTASARVGGPAFHALMAINAFLVLAGAVLSSYVGVSGLVSRMAADNCLPVALAKRKKNGSYPRILIAFFLLSSSILLLTKGDLFSLAGVYTLAFLGVMCLFALGNLILRINRPELKRTYTAPLLYVIIGFFAAAAGVIGNIYINPNNLAYFSVYFFPAALLVCFIVYQDYVLRFALRVTKPIGFIHRFLEHRFRHIIEGRLVAFIKRPDRLHKILSYINLNETSRNIFLVHCSEKKRGHANSCIDIRTTLQYLKKAGAYPHLNVKLICKHAPFEPSIIPKVAHHLRVRENRVLIGSIHATHPFAYADLYGARIIF